MAPPYKQECIREIIRENCKKAKAVIKKNRHWLPSQTYHVFDFTAGDMADKETSPHIFLDEILFQQVPDFKYYPFEHNSKTAKELEKNLKKYMERNRNNPRLRNSIILYQDEVTSPEGFHKYDTNEINGQWHLGLAYYDPNGCGGWEEWEYLQKFIQNWKQIDILFNISIMQWKKLYWLAKKHPKKYIHGAKHDVITLSDRLKTLPRKEWWIRRATKNNWKHVMLFGTNMPTYQLSHVDFHKVDLTNLQEPSEGNYLLSEYDKFIKTETKK